MDTSIQFERTDSASAEFRALVEELDRELWERYPDTMQNYVGGNIVDAGVRVVILRAEGVAVGCGCLRAFEAEGGTVELKRMFLRKAYRGGGRALALVAELAAWAEELGYARIILETGVRQPEAIRLYEKAGFARIPAYGRYAGDPESLCMELRLTRGA